MLLTEISSSGMPSKLDGSTTTSKKPLMIHEYQVDTPGLGQSTVFIEFPILILLLSNHVIGSETWEINLDNAENNG